MDVAVAVLMVVGEVSVDGGDTLLAALRESQACIVVFLATLGFNVSSQWLVTRIMKKWLRDPLFIA